MKEKESPIKILLRRVNILKNFLFSGIKLSILKPYWHNKDVFRVILFSLFINFIIWIYLIDNYINIDTPIILHYNLFFGVDLLGAYIKVFLLPVSGLVILLINAILGQAFYKSERLASYLLTFNALMVQILLLISSYLIVRVNN